MAGSIRKLTISLIFLFLMTPAFSWATTSVLDIDWTSALKKGKVGSKKNLNFSTPTVIADSIYIGNSGGYFYSINFKDGKKIWRIKLEGPIESSPIFSDGTVYLGDGKGVVYSINAANGEINWHSFIGEGVMATPAIDSDNLYIATQNNSLFALDRSSGTIKWQASRPHPFSTMTIKGHSAPVLIDKNIYVGNTDGVLVVYDSSTGKKLKTIPVAAGRSKFTDIDTTPLKEGEDIIFSTMEGALHSLNYKNGKERWIVPIGTPNDVTYNDGRLYVTNFGKIYALDAMKGETLWETDIEAPQFSSVAVNKKYLAIVSTNDKVYILDKDSGKVLLERHLSGGSFGSPIINDGKLVILSNSGQLFAFRIVN